MTALLATLGLQVLANITVNNTLSNQGPGLAVTESTLQNQSATLPGEYVAHPEIGVAYKFVDVIVSWGAANDSCVAEGARLALIDSFQKLRYLTEGRSPKNVIHVGIRRDPLDTHWISSSNEPVVENLPWDKGEPWGLTHCVVVNSRLSGLSNRNCKTMGGGYVCEIPIPIPKTN